MRQLYVRYSYVNPIIEMLCSSFDYYLEVEESYLGDSLVKVSKESKADYISWRLMKDKNMKSILTNILVLETKHLNKLTLKEIAQTIGYYCISKCNDNQAGVAVVLNQSEKGLEFRFIAFLYTENPSGGYGIQGLVFPSYQCSYEQLMNGGDILKFLFLFCMPSEHPPLTLECPLGVHLIKPRDINGVYTD